MIPFFLSAAALLLLVLFVIVRAMLKNRDGDALSREQQNIAIARERLAELQAQNDKGDLNDQEYAAQKEEIERALLDDLGPETTDESLRGGGRWAAFAVAAALPIFAGMLYLTLGRPAAIMPSAVGETAARIPGDEKHPADMQQMVAQLAARMKENPDDAEGWAMLARSYMTMQRFPEAVEAFENIQRLVPDDPQVLVRYADAMAMANGGRLEGEPMQLVERALELQPDSPQGLWMAGTAARQSGDYAQAVVYLERLVPLLEGDAKTQSEIRQLIANTKGSLESADGSGATAPAAPAAPATVASASSLTVEVNLDPNLKEKADPQDMVFIFARAVQGPPMPLAVVRKRVADLPVTVTLDDSSAMMPQMKLSRFDQVKVGARISKTGQALPASGDLQGVVSPVATNSSAPVQVLISEVVP